MSADPGEEQREIAKRHDDAYRMHVRRSREAPSWRQRKLYDEKGQSLGLVFYPSHWEEALVQDGCVQFYQQNLRTFYSFSADAIPNNCGVLHKMALQTASYDTAGVYLFGGTVEEFEQIPGCAFIPGAAHTRLAAERSSAKTLAALKAYTEISETGRESGA